MKATYEPIDAIGIVTDNLPKLVTSSDIGYLKGAEASGKYLYEQAPRVEGAENLMNATHNVWTAEANLAQDMSDAPLVIRGLWRVMSRLLEDRAHRDRAIALFSLAQYRVATAEDVSRESLVEDFSSVYEAATGRFNRASMHNLWLQPYYRRLLKQESVSKNELAAIQAGRLVARRFAVYPKFYIHDVFDGHRLKRKKSSSSRTSRNANSG